MPKNKLSDLRDHLFETLEALKDPDNMAMSSAKAHAVCEVADRIIDIAKVEVHAASVLDGRAEFKGAFFNVPEEGRELPRIEQRPPLQIKAAGK
jgi:hypothetical protein